MEYFTDHSEELEKENFDRYKAFKHTPYNKVKKMAEKLKGMNVLHINTAFNSGGVAEILKSQVPLEQSLGINSHWLVMKGSDEFFQITKKIHNELQGKKGSLSAHEKETYLQYNKDAAQELLDFFDGDKGNTLVILHDPQPLPMIEHIEGVPVISRIHIDLSNVNKTVLGFLKPLLLRADHVVVSDKRFLPKFIQKTKASISFPAIDAFTQKNIPLDKVQIRSILQTIGLDPDRPIATQVSRFDPWKDPEGVIEAYLIAKKKFPDLQLVLAGLIVAEDDPEAKGIYANLQKKYGSDSDIHLYGQKTPPGGISNEHFINALQTGSEVVIQKSIKEGFGLTVTEAMFKSQPVIGGNAGGIKHQIVHQKNGFIVNSPKACAKYMIELLTHPKIKKSMGKEARKTVEKHFLMPSLLLDHLNIYKKLVR
jgi:trehalose synthase